MFIFFQYFLIIYYHTVTIDKVYFMIYNFYKCIRANEGFGRDCFTYNFVTKQRRR